jgi:hypothetical protein
VLSPSAKLVHNSSDRFAVAIEALRKLIVWPAEDIERRESSFLAHASIRAESTSEI